MISLRKTLPSGPNLFTFEAAARHLNFTKAGEELNITQPAVSRRIRNLEEFLEIKLFIRSDSDLKLTESGSELYRSVSKGLRDISQTIREIKNAVSPLKTVVFSSAQSFMTHRLLPHMHTLRTNIPEIRLIIDEERRDSDVDLIGVDLALVFGEAEDWSDYHLWHFCDEELFLVCSPEYARAIGGVFSLSNLASYRILGTAEVRYGWPGWLEAIGRRQKAPEHSMVCMDYGLVIQAALRGEGIALGLNAVVDDYLSAGALVRLGTFSMRTEKQYFLAAPKTRPLAPETALVRDWILRSTTGFDAEACGVARDVPE